jgi:MarR family transcriptional regulator, organic hydroperoxide resistance regulator
MARPHLIRPKRRPPAIGIGKLLRRAHMAFSREFRKRLARHAVTFGEFVHLERLWDEDGLTQTELSNRVGIVTASSTQIIETLEKRGFIRRERNHGDRRHINVFLTPTGERLKQPLLSCARETNRIARSGLKTDEIFALFALIEKINRNLEDLSIRNGITRRRRKAAPTKPARSRKRRYSAPREEW